MSHTLAKRSFWSLTLLMAAALLAASLPVLAHAATPAPQVFDKGKWAPATYQAVNALIEKNGSKNPAYNAAKKPYVVFDWDNTSIMHDTEEALFVYQINHLAYKLTPEEFGKVIRTNVPEGPFSDAYKNVDGKPVTLDAIASDLVADYTYLYQNYEGLKGSKTLEEVKATEQFADFRAKLYFLYEAINDTHSNTIGYPWVLYLFTNMTIDEVHQLAEVSNDASLGMAIEKVTWTSPKALAGKAGVVKASHTTGLRLTSEVANLMNTLRANGIDVYVVSASLEDVVRVFATLPKYGYNLPSENIIGMRLKTENGLITNVYQPDYPITVGHGKTEVIESVLVKKYGYGPIFIAGDSNGDFEMMTELDSVQLALVVNRVKGGKIGQQAAKAAEQLGKASPTVVLQGRDENTGMWIPSESTIRLGEKEPQLISK
ncbi:MULTISPECIES: haloacid dehalogenase-like hydrolase [Bacillota]|uniref:haloacid dehalogenase-like hydrolase n=1 Tax=Bacillota TaxID=1239 RepID=UPI0002717601|nr:MULTISPECIES: haloacid dehalogenase-like hydrolase [Bacillota]EJL47290.1 phosphoserine phosphatase [Brevibacillus sp. CF112]MBY0052622.1 haloacid dehalogenase-like hydrolase [Brevibacillus agri]MDN4095743.1 haloacid dehalogenase-like hydrolase [Brevibacillus agri]MDT8018949.1 haloacid dehalogenase-like hydrolase [Clostridium perfringens]MED1822454.1 haloacid dehalogenase-like hydrolase [Brevibacillus agri]